MAAPTCSIFTAAHLYGSRGGCFSRPGAPGLCGYNIKDSSPEKPAPTGPSHRSYQSVFLHCGSKWAPNREWTSPLPGMSSQHAAWSELQPWLEVFRCAVLVHCSLPVRLRESAFSPGIQQVRQAIVWPSYRRECTGNSLPHTVDKTACLSKQHPEIRVKAEFAFSYCSRC